MGDIIGGMVAIGIGCAIVIALRWDSLCRRADRISREARRAREKGMGT